MVFIIGDQSSVAANWEKVKSLFPLVPTDPSAREKKKRKMWSDITIESGDGVTTGDEALDIKKESSNSTSSSQKQAKLESTHPVPTILSEGIE